jgi:DHA2 family multidrug resistance protein-like MFS transporter
MAAMLVFEKEQYRKEQLQQFDWLGVALSAAFLLCFMLSITYANELGWRSPVVILGVVVSLLFLSGFLMWERRCESPMLPLHLFQSAIFSIGSAARFVSFMAGSASFFLLPFFLVSGVGMATAEAAIYILPGAICMAIFGPISGSISDKIGAKKPAIIGMVLSTVSMYLLTRVSLDSSYYLIALASGMSGTGMSIFMAPNTSSIMWSAGRSHYGIVSAFMNLTRNGAHVVGIAIPTAVVVSVMGSLGYDADLSSLAVMDNFGLRSAYASAMSWAFTVSAVTMFGALLLTIAMPSVQQSIQEEV